MTNEALLLIDIQNDYFEGGAFFLPGMKQATVNAADILSWARETGKLIIHVRHEDTDPSGEFLLTKTDGAKIHSMVEPQQNEIVITKNYPNAFRDTDLKAKLSGISKVILVGAMSNMCIDATARAAFDHGLEVMVVEDACAACDLEFAGEEIPAKTVHGSFMAALASAYGTVTSKEELLKQ